MVNSVISKMSEDQPTFADQVGQAASLGALVLPCLPPNELRRHYTPSTQANEGYCPKYAAKLLFG